MKKDHIQVPYAMYLIPILQLHNSNNMMRATTALT
jgi:hypothetical protein